MCTPVREIKAGNNEGPVFFLVLILASPEKRVLL